MQEPYNEANNVISLMMFDLLTVLLSVLFTLFVSLNSFISCIQTYFLGAHILTLPQGAESFLQPSNS